MSSTTRSSIVSVVHAEGYAMRRVAVPFVILVVSFGVSRSHAQGIGSLKHGTYVFKEVPCAQASNSSVMTFDGRSFKKGRFCPASIVGIPTNQNILKIQRDCSANPGDRGAMQTDTFVIRSSTEFIWKNEFGEFAKRLCEDASLPEEWRQTKTAPRVKSAKKNPTDNPSQPQVKPKPITDVLLGTWEAENLVTIKGRFKSYLIFDGRGNVTRIDREPGEWVAFNSYYIIKNSSEFDWGGMKTGYSATQDSLEIKNPNGTRLFIRSASSAPTASRQVVEAVLPQSAVPQLGSGSATRNSIAQEQSVGGASSSPDVSAVRQCMGLFYPSTCGSVSIIDVRQVDRRITGTDATVIAEVDFRVGKPFAGCSPVAVNCTGTCWDMDPTKVRSTPDATLAMMPLPPPNAQQNNWFIAGQGLRIRKRFEFQKFESGWRCTNKAMGPLEGAIYLNQ
jgi:hypothetical protein